MILKPADTTNTLRRVGIDALFGPVGRHPWVNEAGKVDAAKAGTWMANIILMAGGSPKTAFACALEVATDITDNPAKFKDFAPWPNDNTEEIKLMNQNQLRDDTEPRSVDQQQACSAWTRAEPTEQGAYWMWDGDEESLPIHVEVLWSGHDGRCFVPSGQWGWTEPQSMDDLDGHWWSPLTPPPLPNDKNQTPPPPRA